VIECRKKYCPSGRSSGARSRSLQAKAGVDQESFARLKHTVDNFEASHPQLVALVTEYTPFLSALSHQKPGAF
jgi:hypothetical protein